MNATANDAPVWISIPRAVEITGINYRRLVKLCDARKFTVRQPPGGQRRLLLSECEAYASQVTRPAQP
jgi:hypothetical protein